MTGFKIKRDESHLIRTKPEIINSIFSMIFNSPILEPYAVPKQPQSIFNPLNRLMIIAIVKTINRNVIIAEFSFTDMPKRSNIAADNSIQGIIIAVILIIATGNNL